MLSEKQIYKPSSSYLLRDKASEFSRKKSFSRDNSPKIILGSLFQESDINEWDQVLKAEWTEEVIRPEIFVRKSKVLKINNIILHIPAGFEKLNQVFLQAKYILDLEEDWDDEGGNVYEEDVWKQSAEFLISYLKWIKNIYDGVLYMPKMYHGPNGSIDFVWDEEDFRFFLNINYIENKGSFFTDSTEKQYSEGEFLLDNVKFNLLPLPIKY
ncbi:hypothetical protein [Zobellia roscoffensis]|uniref:hypothetical protein n=1 Tax=Zobellia roscoffensis TaxID=2779508 RepID=UPI00188B891E|nr:hypothetical protein [Zobellia roscoffensis]